MISVCIASYNGAAFIGQQLASILCQIGSGDEVVVSDDGSTDGTPGIVRRLADPRIRLVEGPRKGSPTLNFERALSCAKGDIIFLADQDDVWKPTKVATCLAHLRRKPCVVSDAEMADDGLNMVRPSYFAAHGTRRGRLFNLFVRNGYMGCCMAFRRSVLDAALPFPAGIPMHDIWIGNVAAFMGGVDFIAQPLVAYRCHAANNSPTARLKSDYTFAKKITMRMATAKCLAQRLWQASNKGHGQTLEI